MFCSNLDEQISKPASYSLTNGIHVYSRNEMLKNAQDGKAQQEAWRTTGRFIGKEDVKLAGVEEEDADEGLRWRAIESVF